MDSSQSDDQNQVLSSAQTNPGASTVTQNNPPTVSVTPGGRESAPMSVTMGEVSDFAEPAAHESAPVLDRAVENAGVEVSKPKEEIVLTKEHNDAGIEAAKESVAMSLHPHSNMTTPWPLPRAEQEAGGKANNSSTWLGKLVVFVFGQQQYKKHE